ncbi:MAG: Unknown protein [uncultured Thiotrichaceae bacterium]|uniref:Uncharacterized protein n=1 Tax=uncultured Thiotrichaceae bacterium TaxID=298394 RepID=A0A6S6SAF5_9GAMM|nr:MAG: Unknown protein [uncultured Thiotrichaceae bacterium]
MPNIDSQSIETCIQSITQHIQEDEVKSLVSALEALQQEPQNESYFEQFSEAFNNLGATQGAVLTYAPYLMVIMADDPFDMLGDDD